MKIILVYLTLSWIQDLWDLIEIHATYNVLPTAIPLPVITYSVSNAPTEI